MAPSPARSIWHPFAPDQQEESRLDRIVRSDDARIHRRIRQVGDRLLIVLTVSVVLMSLLVLAAVREEIQLREQNSATRASVVRMHNASGSLNAALSAIIADEQTIVLNVGDQAAQERAYMRWEDRLEAAKNQLEELRSMPLATTSVVERVDVLEELLQDYEERTRVMLGASLGDSRLTIQGLNELLVPMRPVLREVRVSGGELIEAFTKLEEAAAEASVQASKTAVRWQLAAGAVAVVLAEAIGMMLYRSNLSTVRSLARLRYVDALTGVLNRVGMRDKYESSQWDGEGTLSMVILDLDHFQVLNDIHSHSYGDRVLQLVTETIVEQTEPGDHVSRQGSNEFAVMIQRETRQDVQTIVEEILASVRTLRFKEVEEVHQITITAGICWIDRPDTSYDEVLAAGEAALLMAKGMGRDRIASVDAGVVTSDGSIRSAMRQLVRLNRVLDAGDLRLAFQAMESVEGAPRQCELLLRGYDAMLGEAISPLELIGPAERFGMMHVVDRWVISMAMQHLAAGHLDEFEKVCINLSGHSICQTDFREFVVEMLRLHSASAHKVSFELTETAIIDDFDAATQFVHAVRELGATFSIDDFGSGTAAYSMLRELNFDMLKIDGQFVDGMLEDSTDLEVVRSAVRVARTQGMAVVAEKVETAAQMDVLRELGVDYFQGFGCHRPELLPTVDLRESADASTTGVS